MLDQFPPITAPHYGDQAKYMTDATGNVIGFLKPQTRDQRAPVPMFSTDPVTGGVKGLVDTKGGGYLLGTNGFVPATDDYAGIMAAYNAAVEAGGGIVKLPTATITLTAPLPLSANVQYIGTGCAWNMYGHDLSAGGTKLVGDGTFNAFEYNPADLAAPYATGPLLKASELKGGSGVKNLSLDSFLHGIKCGALYQGGAALFEVDNVTIRRCTSWGFWFENCESLRIGTIVALDNLGGQVWIGASGTNLWNYGDSSVSRIFCQGSNGGIKARGICVEARGAGSSLNDFRIEHIGINGYNSLYSATSTLTANSANIAIPDLSKVAVNSAVYFSATVGNIILNRVYFVLSVSGSSGAGNITIATSKGGAVVTPSTSGSPTINNHGGTLVEVGGNNYLGAGAVVTYSTFPHIDCEGNGTAGILIQNCTGCTIHSNSTVSNKGIVMRSLSQYNTLHISVSSTPLDADDPSKKATIRGAKPLSIVDKFPLGIVYEDAKYGLALYLAGTGESSPDVWIGDTAFPGFNIKRSLVMPHSTRNNETLYHQSGQVLTSSAAADNQITLPAIVVEMLGMPYYVSNPTAFTTTINTSSAQTIDNVPAATTFTMAANTTAMLIAHRTSGGVFYWARYK